MCERRKFRSVWRVPDAAIAAGFGPNHPLHLSRIVIDHLGLITQLTNWERGGEPRKPQPDGGNCPEIAGLKSRRGCV